MKRAIIAIGIAIVLLAGIFIAWPSKKSPDDGAASQPASSINVSARPASTTAPIKLNGSGQQASDKFSLNQGLATFNVHVDNSQDVSIWLKDNNGNDVVQIAGQYTEGAYDGSKAVHIPADGTYLLDVNATAGWSVSITQ